MKDLSQALGVPMPELIKILMGLGQMRTATQSLSDEEVEIAAAEEVAELEPVAVVEEAGAAPTAAEESRDEA